MYTFLIILIKLMLIVCPDCKQICQNKAGLISHMNFKHGTFANLASKTHGSVSPEAPTSAVT